MKRDETRWEYNTNLGEKRRISGSRGYRDMMERGSEKERPDGGQGSDDASDAPHRKTLGGNSKPHPVPLLLPSGMSWHGKNRKRPVKHWQRGVMWFRRKRCASASPQRRWFTLPNERG